MYSSKIKTINKRELLRTTGRVLALGGLGWLGFSSRQKENGSPSNVECAEITLCNGCGIFEACTLPKALRSQQHKPEKHNA